MATKSEQLQIRLTPRQKAALRRRAERAGVGLSAYVLERVLPRGEERFAELVSAVADDGKRRFALAELNDLLSGLGAAEFAQATAEVELAGLSPRMRNYVAAMVEQAAHLKGVRPPDWVIDVEPLGEPWFAVPFASLRLHLMRSAPVPFKRRNLFVDSAIGDRV